MSEPFLAEIRIFAGNFAPRGWAFCDGQVLSIVQNVALFALLGTTYGGNGQTTFALPNLQGRSPVHAGQGPGLSPVSLGEMGGQANVTLLNSEMPQHTHPAYATTTPGSLPDPGSNAWGVAGVARGTALYGAGPGDTQMGAALTTAGSSQPHNNMPPYLTLNFIIALQGIFPARP